MRPKPVSLRGLRTFCVAAKHESFSAAGEELFITPSAVSHQIKSLEEELGLRLFDRAAREIRLTGTGRALYAEIGPHVEQIDAIVATFHTDAPRSLVRMSVQPFFASEFFVPRLSEFTARNPEIDIQGGAQRRELGESSRGRRSVDTAVPLAAAGRRVTPPVPAAAPAGRLAGAGRSRSGSKTSGSSATFRLIIHESLPEGLEAVGEEHPASGYRQDSKVTRLDSMIAVVRAVEQGIGAALVPVPMADQWFRQGTLVRLFDRR